MAILSKYSQTLDTQSKQYTSQKGYIDSLGTSDPATQPDDFRTPFTYSEWIQRNAGIIPGNEYSQYNQYLKEWHQNTYTVADTVEQVKENYYGFLQELSIAFSTPEEAAWFADIDITDDLDLEEAIPMFTKKLKEIAIYFINKRDAIKKAKLKYNMVGSTDAINKLFYEYLLKAFTQRDYILNVPEQSAYDTFPALSAVRDGFQIFIEELYDDTNYFDRDPTLPVSSYFNLTAAEVVEYYDTLGFDISAVSWLFETGVSEVHANNPLLWTLSSELALYNATSINELPLSAFSEFDNVLLNKYVNVLATQKYLGEEQYIISGGYYELDTRDLIHDFVSGNNWFYWPSGEYFREAPTDVQFDPIMLSATSLISDGAVAALKYEDADKVFTQVGQTLSGAWLRYTQKYTEEETMQATLFAGENTRFKFPYPGYGLSGDGAPWTGPQLVNALPIGTYSEAVLKTYWDTQPVSAIELLSIHDTTLVNNDAQAAQEYGDADKITVRITDNIDRIHDTTPNETYQDKIDRAWLYKMLNTDLPLIVGQTYINWPVHTYDKEETTLELSVLSSQCISIPLSTVDVETTMIGARAGQGLFNSDIIYKLDAPNGYPTECAWLSGTPLKSLASPSATLIYNASGAIQPSFTLRCRPGRFERFVWYDDAVDLNSTTLVHHEHQVDCPYVLESHTSIHKTQNISLADLGTNGIGGWNDCRCRAIKYSPLGHPGDDYSDFSYMADIIFVDTQFPSEFDLDTWRGSDSLPYNQSKDFAFFQLTSGNNVEPDVGWGPGSWKTGDGSTFQLVPGVLYRYLRANLLRNPGDLIIDAVPDLIIKDTHTNTPKSTWMRAVLSADGAWHNTNNISPMIITPGDYVMYDHIDSNWYCLSSSDNEGTSVARNTSAFNITPSNWATFDFVTTGISVDYIWPSVLFNEGPVHVAAELSAVAWIMETPTGGLSSVSKIDPANPFSFIAEDIGIYAVSAIGYGTFPPETFAITTNLSSFDTTLTNTPSGALGVETIYNDRINMLINIPLTGWNYTTNQYDVTAIGARPFWAKAYDTSNDQTKQKGTLAWGGGIRLIIDDYTFVTQPDISTMSLSSNYYVDYLRKGSSSLTWTQPVEFIINEEKREWCKLLLDPSVASPLDDYLLNITNEMVISASVETSNMMLENSSNMFVNYWSNIPFTWNQEIVNSTNGLPPTGGRWVPTVSGELVDPLVPYANLTNRHFPTIASVPYVGNLYTTEYSGGYFVPRMLGTSVYVGKGWETEIDTSVISNDLSARGITASFRDPDKYIGKDRGLSKTNQLSPIISGGNDQRWQKGDITEGFKAGDVVGAKEYQEYIPYQTKYESTGINSNGLRTQSEKYDPWTGSTDSVWADPTYFPPNFKNEHDINGWYDNNLPENTFIYEWKTDIFGNNYALLKDNTIEGVYDRKQAFGTMWIRNQENLIAPISALFPTYDIFQDAASSVDYTIKNFDLWYDTLMLQTSSHVIIEYINFDYDTNRIFTIADNVNAIDLESLSGGQYGGHWLFDEEKRVTLCQVLSDAANNTVYPILYNYDIDSVERTTLFNLSGHGLINGLSALNMNRIEEPVFSFNQNTKNYNITFAGHSSNYAGIIINSINVNEINGIQSVYSITPNLTS